MSLRYYLIIFLIIFQALPVIAEDKIQSKILILPQETGKVAPMVDFDYQHDIPDPKAAPEGATGFKAQGSASGQRIMIATADPLATQAGFDILSNGGSAADAAFAAQLVLGLVEPQSSGLGGGGFALYWDAQAEELTSYDGRETAPTSASEQMFMDTDGNPMKFFDAATGGLAVGVPGMPKLLDTLFERHGKIDRNELFQPALELSKYGFMVTKRLEALAAQNASRLEIFKDTKQYFLPNNGNALQRNQNVLNAAYNDTLFDFKTKGAKVFYNGMIAQDIIETVNNAPQNPGKMNESDFLLYRIIKRDPVCGYYRTYKVCSMGEPSSGGLTILSALGVLDRFNLEDMSANDPDAWHFITEASRLAFADRNQYMADPDYADTPGKRLIDPVYMAVRSSMIETDKAMADVKAGVPYGWKRQEFSTDERQKNTGTTHISAIDQYGNAISLTSSIETAFGSKLMTNGFLLNNQLTDFSFRPVIDGQKVANRAAPGKRPRSSMSPVIVFDENNQPILIIGSAGGSRIIGYVLQRIISVLDWGMPIDEALGAPHILSRGSAIEIEDGRERDIAFSLNDLLSKNHKISRPEMNSGLTALHFKDGTWHGAADPRREGVAMGE